MEKVVFPGRVGLQQRALAHYRAPFFDRFAGACDGGLSVFAGAPRPGEAKRTTDRLETAHRVRARNVHLLGGALYICLQPEITRWLKRWDPEVLILEANPRYWSSLRAATWMHRRGRFVIGWGLGVSATHRALAGMRRFFLSHFDAMIAYSSVGAEQYRAAGFPRERVFIAPNSVCPPPPPLEERPPPNGRPPRLLFVGRLQARKRVDLLLRACAAVEPKPELCVVGDGPMRGELEQLASQVHRQSRFAGVQYGPALERLFAEADLFVLPGTGGLAVQEAMAHALPVVVAEADGTQKDLVTPDNGWLVPQGDLTALTEVLREALTDPMRLRRMGAASHQRATEHFNIDVMVKVFVQVLHTVRNGHG